VGGGEAGKARGEDRVDAAHFGACSDNVAHVVAHVIAHVVAHGIRLILVRVRWEGTPAYRKGG